jgi:hypothetical protein
MLFGDSVLKPSVTTYYGGNNNGLGVIDTPVVKVEPPSNNNNGGTSVGATSSSPKKVEPPSPVAPASEPSGWGVSNTGDGKAVATSSKKEISPEAPSEPTNWGAGAISEGSTEPERPPMSKELIDQIVNRPIEPTTGYVQPDGTVKNKPYEKGDAEIEEAAAIDRIKTAALAEEDRRKKELGIKDSDTNENKATKEPISISQSKNTGWGPTEDFSTAYAAAQAQTGTNKASDNVVMSSAGGGTRNNRSTLANKAVFGGMSNSAHPGYSLFGGV